MKFFNKSRIKIRKEITEEAVKFYIDYSSLKDKLEYKIRLLTDLASKEHCLIIIDSKMQRKGSNQEETSDELEGYLTKNNIIYEKIEVKGSDSVSVLGVSIKLDNKNRPKNYIIGLVISEKDLYRVRDIMNNYNSRLYIGYKNENLDVLKNIIKIYINDEEMFDKKFKYSIFDNNLLESMSILSEIEALEKTKDIIEQALN